MEQNNTFITHMKPQYFWDVDFAKLDDAKNQRLIIERVMLYGSLREIVLLIEYYGKPAVIRVCTKTTALDPKSLNFIAKLFKLPKSNFRCPSTKLLKPQR
jgi:hypothetical protein